ncbi:class I SAM-dependent methyltransferase [Acidisoma sp.]|uniref:class I SAM-dependent methyltransferase n=1 Tax=Acidisoma sp. TaxID=1872115 RepID=UPI003AFFE3C1
MSMNQAGNAAQIDYWNATAGQTWAAFQAQLDLQLEPLGAEGIRVLAPSPGEHILDIGCGCGHTSFALAERVRPSGAVVGVDISQPMLTVAKDRSPSFSAHAPVFRQADAQIDDLGQAAFDGAFSRFGVMFFSDPVAAFTNIRHALKPGGRLAFVCWRPLDENPWMSVPLEAARPLLPPQPAAEPSTTGPFAFADPSHVRAILDEAGFSAISITPFDARVGSGGLEETVALCRRIGPLGAALRENPDRADEVLGVVREALAAYLSPMGVLMPAAVWIVSAAAT